MVPTDPENHALPQNTAVDLADNGSVRDTFDVATNKADIVKFTCGQAVQGFARHATVIPSDKHANERG